MKWSLAIIAVSVLQVLVRIFSTHEGLCLNEKRMKFPSRVVMFFLMGTVLHLYIIPY